MPEMPPIVDLNPWFGGDARDRAQLCRHVGQLCHEVGFFYVVNHGIPASVSADYNTGELLQLVTHNYFIATPHRVINSAARDRYSSAFFYSPDLNTVLDPLPIAGELIQQTASSERHRGEGLMASRAEMAAGTAGMASQHRPTVFGERYWQRWVRSYPDIAARYYPERME